VNEIHLDRDVLSTLKEVMEEGYLELLDTFLNDSEARLACCMKRGTLKN